MKIMKWIGLIIFALIFFLVGLKLNERGSEMDKLLYKKYYDSNDVRVIGILTNKHKVVKNYGVYFFDVKKSNVSCFENKLPNGDSVLKIHGESGEFYDGFYDKIIVGDSVIIDLKGRKKLIYRNGKLVFAPNFCIQSRFTVK